MAIRMKLPSSRMPPFDAPESSIRVFVVKSLLQEYHIDVPGVEQGETPFFKKNTL
jgi:hypothetical protein